MKVETYDTKILDHLLNGPASTIDIAKGVGGTKRSISTCLFQLRDWNLVKITGKQHSGQRGKPANIWSLP